MTFGDFNYVDPDTVIDSPLPFVKPWAKVDGDYASFKQVKQTRPVTNIRGMESQFGTDISGFAAHYAPSVEKAFTDDATIRTSYYAEVEALLREKLPGAVAKVVIFDHTIRRHEATSARQPVRQVHVDQTPGAAVARVRRHLPAGEAEELLQGRFQIINVWRPIGHVASDLPLALVDWRSTAPKDLVAVDLLYPKRAVDGEGDDDRGKEVRPDPTSGQSTEGYEVKGETYSVAPNDNHKFCYMKDMTPDEVMLIKCFDSRSQGQPSGKEGIAGWAPHTAFEDPETPADAEKRQSIEVRCLVFYNE